MKSRLQILLIFLFLFSGHVFAQETVDSTLAWQFNTKVGLAGSQAAYSNWLKGGVNATALTGSALFTAHNETESTKQNHQLHLSYGILKIASRDVQKSVDQIKYDGWLLLKTDFIIDPTITFDLRTQFAPTYDYANDGVKVSDLFAPAITNQAVGGTYAPTKWFKTFLGFGTKESVVLIERLQTIYGHKAGEKVKFEGGLDWRAQIDKTLFTNITLHSKIYIFSSFNDFGSPDLYWNNLLELKVNNWMNTNLEFVAFYDKNVLDKVQVKQVLSVGLNFSF